MTVAQPDYDQRIQPLSLKDTNLFKPIKLGDIEVSHRVVLAPLTRLRADPDSYVPNVELASEYYRQRSEKPGTLIITEGIVVSKFTTGFFDGCPGIWNEEQTEAWAKIFKPVKDNGSFVVAQLFGLGRQAIPDVLARKGIPYKTATAGRYITHDGAYDFKEKALEFNNPLLELTLEEIEQHVVDFIQAGVNCIKAGADGVQVHIANGYLLNQFLDPESNQRTDEYGGSIENRSKLPLKIIDGLIDAIGASKVSVRFSPYSKFGGFNGVQDDPTLLAQYAHIVGELEVRAQQGKRVQFLDIVEPRIFTCVSTDEYPEFKGGNNDFFYHIWKGPIVRAGDYMSNHDALKNDIQDGRTLIAFGRYFISNPDLPTRLEKGLPLNKYYRELFYSPGPKGYTDYQKHSETLTE